MRYNLITVITDHDNADLVASAMFDAGAEGVDIADRQDFADLLRSDVIWDYVDDDALLSGEEVKVSTVADEDDREFLPRLESALSAMAGNGVRYGEISSRLIDEADWANEWKKYYNPIVTHSVTVVPTWIDYPAAEDETVLRLDPGMAFGTGEHATTRMCLEMADARGKSVIDVGCGSGILGIAAALTGAKSVYMCDIDPQAVEAARANAALNGVDCTIERADLIEGKERADLILANLTADILSRLAPSVGEHLNGGGEIVASGIIADRLDEVKGVFAAHGFRVVEERADGDWRALRLGR